MWALAAMLLIAIMTVANGSGAPRPRRTIPTAAPSGGAAVPALVQVSGEGLRWRRIIPAAILGASVLTALFAAGFARADRAISLPDPPDTPAGEILVYASRDDARVLAGADISSNGHLRIKSRGITAGGDNDPRTRTSVLLTGDYVMHDIEINDPDRIDDFSILSGRRVVTCEAPEGCTEPTQLIVFPHVPPPCVERDSSPPGACLIDPHPFVTGTPKGDFISRGAGRVVITGPRIDTAFPNITLDFRILPLDELERRRLDSAAPSGSIEPSSSTFSPSASTKPITARPVSPDELGLNHDAEWYGPHFDSQVHADIVSFGELLLDESVPGQGDVGDMVLDLEVSTDGFGTVRFSSEELIAEAQLSLIVSGILFGLAGSMLIGGVGFALRRLVTSPLSFTVVASQPPNSSP